MKEAFIFHYRMFTSAKPGYDVQFGMDFELKHKNTDFALCQLIFPATNVGTNVAGQWNIDNHKDSGTVDSLIFNGAEQGVILDSPREIVRSDTRRYRTIFAVFLVDLTRGRVSTKGIKFGYYINSSDECPETRLISLENTNMTNEQKRIVQSQCSFIKFM